jgi:hypothetical protein
MVVAIQQALPPGASLEGVGQARSLRVLFSLTMRPRNFFSYSQQICVIILHPFRLVCHQNNKIALRPRPAPLLLPIRSLLSCFCLFLVVVVYEILNQQPSKANVHFFVMLLSFNLMVQQWDSVPPCNPPLLPPI